MKYINLIIFILFLTSEINADQVVDDFEGSTSIIDGGWHCIGCSDQIVTGDGLESNHSLRIEGGTSGFGGIATATLSQSQRDISRFRAISYRFKNINNAVNNDNPDENRISIKFIFGNGSEWEQPLSYRVLLATSAGNWTRVLVPFDTESTGFLLESESSGNRFDLTDLNRIGILLSPMQNSVVWIDNIEFVEPGALHKIVVSAPQRVYTPVSGADQFDTASGFDVVLIGEDSSGLRVINPFNVALSESLNILTLEEGLNLPVNNSSSLTLINGKRIFRMSAAGADRSTTTLTASTDGGITASADIQIRSSSEALDELDFILSLVNSDNDLVRSEKDGSSATLYINALAVIMFTHAEKKGYYDNGFERASQIISMINKNQFDQIKNQNGNETDHELKGAFTNSFSINTGKNNTQNNNFSEIIRNGNNAWYLLSLSYYTIITGDNTYIENIIALADFLILKGQQNDQENNGIDISKTYGAIKHGFNLPVGSGSNYVPLVNITTEHQTESYAGLLLASKISDIEYTKRQNYAESARKILEFVYNFLYNPNHQGSDPNDLSSFFHTGLTDLRGAVNPEFPPSMDAQTWPFLAFGRRFKMRFCTDISGVLDFAKNNLFSSGQINGQTLTGGIWYKGDTGIWLEGYAQLGLAFLVASHEAEGTQNQMASADEIFNSQTKMQMSDGGFQTFSADYVGNTESVGDQTTSGAVTTVWRYFHAEHFNPFDVANILSQSGITVNQEFQLGKGWNKISFNVLPLNVSTSEVFNSLIKNNELEMVVSETSNFNPEYPCSLNSLSRLKVGSGYAVKVNKATKLTISGTLLDISNEKISLKAGWNFIAYFLSGEQSIRTAFASLINETDLNNSNLQIATFGSKTFDPGISDSLNSLTMLTPGAGYWIKLKTAEDFFYPSPSNPGSILSQD